MFVTSCSITALTLVAVDAMLSMNLLKELMNSYARIAPGGGTWARLLDVSGHTVSPLCEIPWMYVAALAESKEFVEGLEFRMT